MENREISELMMENINNFTNLVKIINDERYSAEKVLTERQFFTLVSIRKHKKIELKNLSKNLYVSNSSLCILLNKLVEQGYVYREEDPGDRRNTFYCITEKGDKIVKGEIDRLISIIGIKIDKLSVEQKERLFNCMIELDSMIKLLL
ncbi:MarR family winged helix-turn-helix transcriptional regulator [Romboutsia sp.]|uniref:MarR family winged helix-turn-helix transcriptional regulator n=1 Tax=Romboutsia sp. TaxID=1965302 RepID=UPI002C6B0E4A|nr:MarR family transcriptional regulator [Romboutsia sp.]HSQ88282.1 MarR family transcriptional regulator [Romboutsia sp.]